ncbi:hypothetical protein Tco_0038616 [Tanacetum coccineum]
MDLKWQVAMISMRLKKFYKKTRRKLHFDAKEPVGFDKTKVECFNYHNTWHFARECKSKGIQEGRRRDTRNTPYKAKDNKRRPRKQEEPKALVTLDGDGVDWTDVMNVVMHDDVHNVLSVNTNYLDNDNLALASLKMENDHLMELLISQDLVYTAVNSLAAINDYKSMQQNFLDE